MRTRFAVALGVATGTLSWAGAVMAATEPWQPQSELFQLNYRFASLALLLTAGGIALGLLGKALFRYRQVRLNVAGDTVQRHSTGNMLTHWLNAVGFLLATFSGALLLGWLPFKMTLSLSYLLHYVGAGAILIGFVATVVNASARGTSTARRLIPTGHQIKEAIYELFGYAGLVGDRGILGFRQVQWPKAIRTGIAKLIGFKGYEPSGKYLAAEEVLSYPVWALIGLAIIGSGMVKAVRFAYPLGASVIKWSTVVHDWAAVAIVVMLCFHVGALVLVKTNWPLLASMFTGKVSSAHVRHFHGAWYKELVAEAERKAMSGDSAPSAVVAKAAPANSRVK